MKRKILLGLSVLLTGVGFAVSGTSSIRINSLEELKASGQVSTYTCDHSMRYSTCQEEHCPQCDPWIYSEAHPWP